MATVYAVLRAVVEVPVRSSEATETLQQMMEVAKREAEGVLRNSLPTACRVETVTFSHAVVREV